MSSRLSISNLEREIKEAEIRRIPIKDYIYTENNKVFINWKDIENISGNSSINKLSNYYAVMNLLLNAGILSLEKEGNYRVISGEQSNSNEKIWKNYYFVNKEEALSYISQIFPGADGNIFVSPE